METVEAAFDYLTAPAYGKAEEWSDDYTAAAGKLGPKLQNLVNTIRPQIEAKAREGYIAESDLPARVDAEIARRNAKAREGQEELKRVDGMAPSGDEQSWWSGLTPEGRRDSANIARFDRYTASRR
jgi:hypothetical protein